MRTYSDAINKLSSIQCTYGTTPGNALALRGIIAMQNFVVSNFVYRPPAPVDEVISYIRSTAFCMTSEEPARLLASVTGLYYRIVHTSVIEGEKPRSQTMKQRRSTVRGWETERPQRFL
jgi:hypothetical protein